MDGCGEAGEAQGILQGSFDENFSATSWESCATSSQLRSNFVTNMWLPKKSASGGFSPAKIATPSKKVWILMILGTFRVYFDGFCYI